jgi:hypothetical protein
MRQKCLKEEFIEQNLAAINNEEAIGAWLKNSASINCKIPIVF